MALHIVYLGLGSNLGHRQAIIEQAIELLNQEVGTVQAVSAFLISEPWGFTSANSFLNIALRMGTALSPIELLDQTQSIERRLGRQTKSHAGVYQDRPIDIDILLYDELELSSERLTLPHPLMHERDFVMTPLKEVFLGDMSKLR